MVASADLGVVCILLSSAVALGSGGGTVQKSCECLDLTVGGQPWQNSEGLTCDRYRALKTYLNPNITSELYCNLFTSERNMGYLLEEACCLCGGGDYPCDDQAPPSMSPSATPTASPVPDDCACQDVEGWRDPDGADCEQYKSLFGATTYEKPVYCAILSTVNGNHGTYGESCCFCGGGEFGCGISLTPTTSPAPSVSSSPSEGCTCANVVPDGLPERLNGNWADADDLMCSGYETLLGFTGFTSAKYCQLYTLVSYGHTMAQACCLCGGGDWTCPSASPSPSYTLPEDTSTIVVTGSATLTGVSRSQWEGDASFQHAFKTAIATVAGVGPSAVNVREIVTPTARQKSDSLAVSYTVTTLASLNSAHQVANRMVTSLQDDSTMLGAVSAAFADAGHQTPGLTIFATAHATVTEGGARFSQSNSQADSHETSSSSSGGVAVAAGIVGAGVVFAVGLFAARKRDAQKSRVRIQMGTRGDHEAQKESMRTAEELEDGPVNYGL